MDHPGGRRWSPLRSAARGRGIGVLGAAVAVAGALTNALGYVVPVLGARQLSAGDLGALATVLAIAAIAGVPGLGLQIAVAVHRARHPGAPAGRVGWLTAAVCAGAVVVLTPVAGALLDLPAAVTLSARGLHRRRWSWRGAGWASSRATSGSCGWRWAWRSWPSGGTAA